MILVEREVNMEENQKPTITQGEPSNDQRGHEDDQSKDLHEPVLRELISAEISGLPDEFLGRKKP